MNNMNVQSAAAPAPQQSWSREEEQQALQGLPQEGPQETSPIPSLLDQAEEESKSLVEMIQDAQEKAKAQREAMQLPKNSTRYGDAPLEAYARLARAKSRTEVNAASGYARRRLAQFKAALHTDSDNSARIKAAINQLQKAISRGEKKKRELDREELTEIRRKKAAQADQREKEQRLRQELLRRRSQRMFRESGYMREAEISDRLATQLTATQMELRQQAQELAASTSASLESAVQQYIAVGTSSAALPAGVGFSGQA